MRYTRRTLRFRWKEKSYPYLAVAITRYFIVPAEECETELSSPRCIPILFLASPVAPPERNALLLLLFALNDNNGILASDISNNVGKKGQLGHTPQLDQDLFKQFCSLISLTLNRLEMGRPNP